MISPPKEPSPNNASFTSCNLLAEPAKLTSTPGLSTWFCLSISIFFLSPSIESCKGTPFGGVTSRVIARWRFTRLISSGAFDQFSEASESKVVIEPLAVSTFISLTASILFWLMTSFEINFKSNNSPLFS